MMLVPVNSSDCEKPFEECLFEFLLESSQGMCCKPAVIGRDLYGGAC